MGRGHTKPGLLLGLGQLGVGLWTVNEQPGLAGPRGKGSAAGEGQPGGNDEEGRRGWKRSWNWVIS